MPSVVEGPFIFYSLWKVAGELAIKWAGASATIILIQLSWNIWVSAP